MKSTRKFGCIALGSLYSFTACNYTDGPCWQRGESEHHDGVGGGVILPGTGGYGAVPPDPQTHEDSPILECNSVGGFSASLFKFSTTVQDDGEGSAGGWQAATGHPKFVDGRQNPPARWSCAVTVGMPVRATAHGTISAQRAAQIAADVLTEAAKIVMHSQPTWQPTAFCLKLDGQMKATFKNRHPDLGATASAKR